MPTINDFKPGQTITLKRSSAYERDACTGKKLVETHKIRIIDVDQVKKKILASVNGAPAQWYTSERFTRWNDESRTKPIKQ